MTANDIESSESTGKSRSGVASRRTVLMGVGALGAVAGVTALSACGTSSSSAGSTGAAATTASDGSLAKTADIPVGGGKIFADQKVVVTQPTTGTFEAFTAVCTHQGCIVSTVANGTINCECHGSQYSIVDGSVKVAAIAGQAGLAKKQFTVASGEITVTS
jgi:Rieske Fe-S protein